MLPWQDFHNLAEGQYGGTTRAAVDALSLARTTSDRRAWLIALATAELDGQVSSRLRGFGRPSARIPRGKSDLIVPLDTLVTRLRSSVREAPGSLTEARLLITGATLIRDGPALLEGWRSYYLIAGDSAHGPLAALRRTLVEVLPRWSPKVSPTDDIAVTESLAHSGFFDEATLIASPFLANDVPRSENAAITAERPALRDIVAYDAFLRRLGRMTDAYYQDIALGRGNKTGWQSALGALVAELWPSLAWRGPVPRFSLDSAEVQLNRRFGAMINVGTTAGQLDLHMGHRVVDERRTVRQYGDSAEVRFVQLDAMVSNGYQSWAWDGRAAHGGWGNKNLIVEVRPAYAGAPVAEWRRASDTTARRRFREQIARDSARDVARALSDPYAYLPSVIERLTRDGVTQLIDSLSTGGRAGRALETAFEYEDGRAVQESSIFAHGGRHAIDDVLGLQLPSADLEFRAKLSEVAFAPAPRLAFEGIISPNIGDGTPHGVANARIMRGLVAWMSAHTAELSGVDLHQPLLPQLPKLSDAQLRRAMASMDPLAAPHTS